MKSFLFVFALVFSQVSSADIKIMSFEGISGIYFNGSDYEVALDSSADTDFKIAFYSTDKTGIPRMTVTQVTEQDVELTQKVYPLLMVNQVTTIQTKHYLMSFLSTTQVYRIGIDGDFDGKLDSSSDDYLSMTMTLK